MTGMTDVVMKRPNRHQVIFSAEVRPLLFPKCKSIEDLRLEQESEARNRRPSRLKLLPYRPIGWKYRFTVLELPYIMFGNVERFKCQCTCCVFKMLNTFYLAYYIYHGLKMQPRRLLLDHAEIYVDRDLVAQCIAIVDRRVKYLRGRVYRLFNMALYKVKFACHNRYDLELFPTRIRDLHKHPPTEVWDMVEHDMSTRPGHTVFRPWSAAPHLLNHLDCEHPHIFCWPR